MSVRPCSVRACSEIPRGPEDLPLQFRLDTTKGELGNGKAHRASDLASSRARMICIRSLESAVPPPPIRIREPASRWAGLTLSDPRARALPAGRLVACACPPPSCSLAASRLLVVPPVPCGRPPREPP